MAMGVPEDPVVGDLVEADLVDERSMAEMWRQVGEILDRRFDRLGSDIIEGSLTAFEATVTKFHRTLDRMEERSRQFFDRTEAWHKEMITYIVRQERPGQTSMPGREC